MQFRSKATLAVLALSLSFTPALAQAHGYPQDPPVQQQGRRDGFGQRGPMGNMRTMGPGRR